MPAQEERGLLPGSTRLVSRCVSLVPGLVSLLPVRYPEFSAWCLRLSGGCLDVFCGCLHLRAGCQTHQSPRILCVSFVCARTITKSSSFKVVIKLVASAACWLTNPMSGMHNHDGDTNKRKTTKGSGICNSKVGYNRRHACTSTIDITNTM